jgi:hypothetical protein
MAHRREFAMLPINRALIPALTLSGVLLSLSPMAQAGPPPWAAAYGNGHANYDSRREYGDRRDEHDRRDGRYQRDYRQNYDRVYWDERRAPRAYDYQRRNEDWRSGNDYRNYNRDHSYEGYRGYRGYGGYSGYSGYGGFNYGGGRWRNDPGAYRGSRCGTDDALMVMGAVTGGIIGHQSASRGNRDVATVVGVIAGGILGNAIGSSIDDGDRDCSGYGRSR